MANDAELLGVLPGERTGRVVSYRIGGTVATEAALKAISPKLRADGQLWIVSGTNGPWVFQGLSAKAASPGVLVPDTGSGRFEALAAIGAGDTYPRFLADTAVQTGAFTARIGELVPVRTDGGNNPDVSAPDGALAGQMFGVIETEGGGNPLKIEDSPTDAIPVFDPIAGAFVTDFARPAPRAVYIYKMNLAATKWLLAGGLFIP